MHRVDKESAKAKERAKAKVSMPRSEASMINSMPARRLRQMTTMTASKLMKAGVFGMKMTSTADGPLMMNMTKRMMISM